MAEYYKAVTDYSRYPDGGLTTPATNVRAGIGANAATFPAPTITLAQLKTDSDDFVSKLGDAVKGGTDRTTLKNNARARLEDDLFQLASYVNLVAKGDKATIDLSGFDSYSTARTQSSGGVDFVPQNVRWEDGTVSGACVLRWKGDGKGSMYEVQTCTGDPAVEANWHYRGSFSGGRAELDGFTPGAIAWGRVRKIGTGGEVGNWSDPAQIRAK
jgi:hypothetical protein